MEVLHVYYACALASVYNEGLYAEMYSIDLAAVSTRDYAFGLNNLIHTIHVVNLRQISGNNWKLILKAFDGDCAERS